MKDEAVSAIHNFTLKARELMCQETEEQLEGLYGFLPDGTFEPAAKYPAISGLDEARETRNRLEQYIADEKNAGLSAREAREKLVLEIAFTRLNRLVALKMMETRRIIRQSVSKGSQSNGFLRWLAKEDNEAAYEKYEAGDLPQNAIGEGPRQEAYRWYLLWLCEQLSREIKVLFDPDNIASRIFPRPRALNQLIDMMNDGALEEAWAPGNEETIGWVYQSFNSEALEAAFREVRVSGTKFEAKDIPSVTQLFTPRWIVRYLVENTLGRTWIDMHPDSRLKDTLQYLVPIDSTADISLKSAREITLLDPACGTMHFGLVAFDLFVEMYREELENAGQPGWPQSPSVNNEDEIPAAIIANNIHGIDIDTRAVQLSALTLYLKAKSLNPEAKLTDSNLVAARVELGDDKRMQAFMDEVGLKRPIYQRILKSLSERLKDSKQLGSLLRIEDEIQNLIERERKQFNKEGRQTKLFGEGDNKFESRAVQKEFWDSLEGQIELTLHHFAKTMEEQQGQSFFGGETVKGLRLLELLSKRYNVVVTNPPYMSNRNMNAKLKEIVANHYPEGKGDLYGAFIKRCLEMTKNYGHMGMLTMHSFMFITTYKELRLYIRGAATIETMVHTGPSLFAVGNPGRLQTTAYIFSKATKRKKDDESLGIYFRLVKEPNSEAKRLKFEEALNNLRTSNSDIRTFKYKQKDFDSIPESPWVYWITPNLRKVFESYPTLVENSPPRQGLATADNWVIR
ncbi:hypothetical protein HNR65_003167 [Desulfosalsimonas propionicica]|uniref:site-specific DNA-methyltransferase (adenine-specific) n=1 Tax=Desulfosalsimonas propionicica TaxID=332175 RepID=A0A7W0HLZ1_9BACT|nr:BREX-1 system adenine-specific DNA-methyltransferase PglX [Desulfosalsimonas propionicica]MBA2882812.1 hypothetical protein [Desulfosalsimonas propionicica]